MPYDPELRPAPGSIVQPSFWRYINRVDLFPSGWLHDSLNRFAEQVSAF